MDAYLDIETTGLSPARHSVTIVGLCLGSDSAVLQWVGEEITARSLLDALAPATTIYTYNGTAFDLPFLRAKLGVDLVQHCEHHDLMLDCWCRNLYGGLKAVERQLGICRGLVAMDGAKAARLWREYHERGDSRALKTLLDYNAEDVLNLRALRQALTRPGRCRVSGPPTGTLVGPRGPHHARAARSALDPPYAFLAMTGAAEGRGRMAISNPP